MVKTRDIPISHHGANKTNFKSKAKSGIFLHNVIIITII